MNKVTLELKSTIEEVFGSKIRIRILRILAHKGELSLTSLINEIQTNYITALRHLYILQDNNLIEENKFGRIRIFRYKIENIKARMLRELITIWEDTTATVEEHDMLYPF